MYPQNGVMRVHLLLTNDVWVYAVVQCNGIGRGSQDRVSFSPPNVTNFTRNVVQTRYDDDSNVLYETIKKNLATNSRTYAFTQQHPNE